MRDLFDGSTYEPRRDESRLFAQLRAVRSYIADGLWHTLPEISAATGHPEASVSARMRDLRKPRFGANTIEREYIRNGAGLWRYRMVLPASRAAGDA